MLHEAIAWRIAREFGHPFDTLVAPCVLRAIGGIDPMAPGALSAIHGKPLRQGFATWQDVFNFDRAGCASAAFFDSLIGQQDRNPGNVRFDYQARSCRLIDHGYAFARHGDPINISPLVGCRAQIADVRLDQPEIDALHMLFSSGDLCAARDGLDPARAAALERRAESMLQPTILPEGGF